MELFQGVLTLVYLMTMECFTSTEHNSMALSTVALRGIFLLPRTPSSAVII